MLQSSKSQGLENIFKSSNKDIIKAIKGLLEVNPFFRSSATDLIQSSIFDEVRVNDTEKMTADKKIYLKFDQVDSYNYDDNEDLHFKSVDQIRKAIVKEVVSFKQQLEEAQSKSEEPNTIH